MSLRERVRRISFNVLFGVVLGVVLVFVGLQFVQSPSERGLRRELAQYKRQFQLILPRVQRAEKVLADLEERDNVLYRTIFECEPVSDSERFSGIGGVERYASLDGYDNSELIKMTTRKQWRDVCLWAILESDYRERMASMPAIMPIAKDKCKVVSGFGYRFHPILKYRRLHSGIDLAARPGTPVYATGDGVVRVSGRNSEGYAGYGVVVDIDHGFGFHTLYAHMSTTTVKEGHKVMRGEQVGTVGSTGMSTGAHLHYEVILNGKKVDPVYYFFNDLSPQEYDAVIEQARQENQCMS